jgi:hypothetical protein
MILLASPVAIGKGRESMDGTSFLTGNGEVGLEDFFKRRRPPLTELDF